MINTEYNSLSFDKKLKFILNWYYTDYFINNIINSIGVNVFLNIEKYNCNYVNTKCIDTILVTGVIAREIINKDTFIDVDPYSLISKFHNGKKVWFQNNNKIIDFEKIFIIKYSDKYISYMDKIIVENIDYKNISNESIINEIEYLSNKILMYDTSYSRKKKLDCIFL